MATTKPQPLIADMYERWTLDCVVEVVQAVALDFVNRPRQYRNVPDKSPFPNDPEDKKINIAEILQNFWYLSGTDPNFPDLVKRQNIFSPLLGPSDGMVGEHDSQFHENSDALRERARAFTERQVTTGEDNLRRAFLDEVITFRSYLEPFVDNAVVTIGDTQTRNIFNEAVKVLLDDKVTGVFGRPPASLDNWPLSAKVNGLLVGSFDTNGDLVIKFITEALPTSMGPIQESKFVVRQRIASFGAETIREVLSANLSPDPITTIDPLIQLAYSWKTALDALGKAMGSMQTASTPMGVTSIPARRAPT